MSFEIVGDDDYGYIGADIIGDDEAEELLEALSIEGDWDDDDYDDDDELIEGDGGMEIVGARRKKKRRNRAANAVNKIVQRTAKAVISRKPNTARRYVLGFVPTAIAAATTSQIPAAPQNLFRPERLVIPSDIAFDFGVADVKVGNQSQLVQSVEVPGALFSEVAIDTQVTFDTAEVGNQISVNARNKSGGSLEFTAGALGTIAK